jgi:FixJ family two-component response regulator
MPGPSPFRNADRSATAGLQVSVVEDDAQVRKALRQLLSAADYRVVEFDTGEAFLSAIRRQATDCVLLDYGLPGLNGLELIPEILQIQASLPIIMLSACEDEYIKHEALVRGASAFVDKSDCGKQLLNCIKQTLHH